MSGEARHPLSWASLVDYWARDLDEAEEAAMDEHLIGCAECSALSEKVAALTEALRNLIPPVLAPAARDALAQRGLRIVDNPMQPGERREVLFPREADILLHHLTGLQLTDATRVDFRMHAESSGELLASVENVPFDRETGAVLVACQKHYASMPADTVAEIRVHRPAGEQLARYTILHRFESA